MSTKKTREKLTVNSVRCLNMESRDYVKLHARMYVSYNGHNCALHLKSNDGYSISISYEAFKLFVDYELPFLKLVDLYTSLCVASALYLDSSFVLPF